MSKAKLDGLGYGAEFAGPLGGIQRIQAPNRSTSGTMTLSPMDTNLALLMTIAQPVVKGVLTNTPPGSPAAGDAYVIGTSPTGAWVGFNNQVAIWDGTAWQFSGAPKTGWRVIDSSSTLVPFYTWTGTLWTADLNVSGLLNGATTIRAQGSAAPASGVGVEVDYGSVAANTGRVMAFDRTGGTRKDLVLDGSQLKFYTGGTQRGIFDAAGLLALANGLTVGDNTTITSAAGGVTLTLNKGTGAALQFQHGGANGYQIADDNPSGGDLVFIDAGTTERMRLKKTSGLLSLPGGINFGQQDLKNYSVGTWTPTLVPGTSGAVAGYTTQVGIYRRIGDICIASFDLKINGKGTFLGSVRIGGFPFNSSASSEDCGSIGYMEAFTYGTATPFLVTIPGTAQMNIYSAVSGGSGGQVQDAALAAATRLFGSIVYQI